MSDDALLNPPHAPSGAAPEPEAENGPPLFYAPVSPGREGAGGWVRRPPRPPVIVLLQPEEKTLELPKPKTARAVLTALGLKECMALVIRDGELLTPDQAVRPGDQLTVRTVMSRG